jgi:hypothetical protein
LVGKVPQAERLGQRAKDRGRHAKMTATEPKRCEISQDLARIAVHVGAGKERMRDDLPPFLQELGNQGIHKGYGNSR